LKLLKINDLEKNILQTQKTINILKELEDTKVHYIEIQRKLYGQEFYTLEDEIEDIKLTIYNLENNYKLIKKDILYLLLSWTNH